VKIGDLVKYPYWDGPCFAIVLQFNDAGGTIKAHILNDGEVGWLVTSQCEVVNESR